MSPPRAPRPPAPSAPLAPGVLVTPAMIAVLCSLTGLFALGAGAIGSYAVTGWRVTALESRAAVTEGDIRAIRQDVGAAERKLAAIEADIRSITRGIERLESSSQRIERRVVDDGAPVRQVRQVPRSARPRQPHPRARFLRPPWRSPAGMVFPPR